MNTKKIIWTVVIIVVLALIVWGITSLSKDKSGTGNDTTPGDQTVTTPADQEAENILGEEILSEEDDVELGELL